jgi:hypothetical protein
VGKSSPNIWAAFVIQRKTELSQQSSPNVRKFAQSGHPGLEVKRSESRFCEKLLN